MQIENKIEIDSNNNINKTYQSDETVNDIKKALEGCFATGYTPIYINSLKKEIGFKEISVKQQKTLSRIMIGNQQRKDIVYDAQCAIINEACLDNNFNIYDLLELDRIKLLIALYQTNMFSNDVKFTCKNCKTENAYKLDFNNVLRRLDQIDVEPRKFIYTNSKFKFEFTVRYPSVRLVSNFHKQYCSKNKIQTKTDIKVVDTMSNMEYVDLFICGLKLIDINSDTIIKDIDFSNFTAIEREDILQLLPQDSLYSDNGVLKFISDEFLQKLNNSFDKHKCAVCGAIQEDETSDQTESFL